LAERGAGRQIFCCCLYAAIESHDLIHPSHFQGLLHDPLCSNDTQFATCLLHLARAHDKDAHPSAIQIFQLRKIENDLLLMLFQEIFDLPLHFLALQSQGDSAGQPNDNDIGTNTPLLDVQWHIVLLVASMSKIAGLGSSRKASTIGDLTASGLSFGMKGVWLTTNACWTACG
jgi:hypothetical protein